MTDGTYDDAKAERWPSPNEREDRELVERLRETVRICQSADTLGRSVLTTIAKEIEEAIVALRTHSPEEPETEVPCFECPNCERGWADSRRLGKYLCDDCGVWFYVLDNGSTVVAHDPEEPVGWQEGEIIAWTFDCQDWSDRDKVPSTIELCVGHGYTGMVPFYVRIRRAPGDPIGQPLDPEEEGS